jgi:hypothetical protein
LFTTTGGGGGTFDAALPAASGGGPAGTEGAAGVAGASGASGAGSGGASAGASGGVVADAVDRVGAGANVGDGFAPGATAFDPPTRSYVSRAANAAASSSTAITSLRSARRRISDDASFDATALGEAGAISVVSWVSRGDAGEPVGHHPLRHLDRSTDGRATRVRRSRSGNSPPRKKVRKTDC